VNLKFADDYVCSKYVVEKAGFIIKQAVYIYL
jgi:hypothetical protein